MAAVVEALHKVVEGRNLSEGEASQAMLEILTGRASPAQIAALLTALRMKGETVDEVAGFARTMRAQANRVENPLAGSTSLVDTCGTGGDGAGTFNISTVSALVAAGAGAVVAKHGNRSISSRCGSADVLEALGVNVLLKPEQAARSLQTVGIGFLFAPLIHPAMKHAQPIRKELGMRTVFNMLGPLTNPAGAGAQLVGVFAARLVPLLAAVLARLGVARAFVVHGRDGLDEITTTGPTLLAEVANGKVSEREVVPEDFGVARADAADLAGGDAAANAAIVRAILAGERGPKRDIVVVNAAAALTAAGLAGDFRQGAELAAEAIDSGRAAGKLEDLARFAADVEP